MTTKPQGFGERKAVTKPATEGAPAIKKAKPSKLSIQLTEEIETALAEKCYLYKLDTGKRLTHRDAALTALREWLGL